MICGVFFSQTALASGYTATKYPIVLTHGIYGFNYILGVYGYWYGIPKALERSGAKVYVAHMAAADSSEARGEQLLKEVEQIVASTGVGKVNLIRHSYGAQSVRYVAGVRPDLVASVTTIAGPNKGSAVADVLNDDTNGLEKAVLSKIADGLGDLVDILSSGGYKQDSLAALKSLTTQGAAKFNRRFPAGVPKSACGSGRAWVHGIFYSSMGGTSHFTNALDISDPALALTGLAFGGKPNDGLISRCSNHLGFVIRDNYKFNHLDEINQIAGLTSWFETDPREVYRQQANRLKEMGL
jgi:triacylglycerol lipase